MVTKEDKLLRNRSRAEFRGVRLSQSIVAGSTALLDAVVLAGTGFLIYWIHVGAEEPQRLPAYTGAIVIFTLVTLQTYSIAGFYRFSSIIHPAQQVVGMITILIATFLLMLACAFALKISEEFSRIWAFSWLLSTALLVPTGRFAVVMALRRLARRGHLGRNIIIYGAGEQAAALIRHIEELNEPWNRIVGIFDDRITRGETKDLGYRMMGNLQNLLVWARVHRTDEILIALPWSAERRLRTITHILSVLPADIRLSPEFIGAEFLHRRTSLQYGVPMLSVLEKPVSGWAALTKQIMDKTLAALFLVISLPVMAAIAVCIKCESPGPVLFRQKRCGFNNRIIEVLKFRTMYVEHTDQDADRLTQPNDPRVTRVGTLLRRFSLDELPQLLNVLRGDMSVVGPRPHALQAKAGDKLYDQVIDQYASRHKVKPGITGWAQVNGCRGNTETEADLLGRLEHDLYYIEHWSVLLDLIIIVRTVFVVLKGENSY